MIRIGIVGVGFMGMMHYIAAQRVKGAKVIAICSRDKKKLAGDWRGIRGNFGPPGKVMDLGSIKRYSDYGDLVKDPDIDLIDICTPPDLHSVMAMGALLHGKHVFVEKPIALETRQANKMVKLAAKTGKLLMVGQVLPFFPEFAYAAEVIRTGEYGKLLGAHFKRVISKPDWSTSLGDPLKDGGPVVDLHIHDAHFIRLIAGVPSKVFATGVVAPDHSVQYLTTSYLYRPGGPAITCSSGALSMPTRPFTHGYEIYLEQATLTYESGVQPLTLLPAKGKPREIKLKGGGDDFTAFALELQAAVDGIQAGKEPHLLSGKLARDALVLCFKERDSVLKGKPVTVSAAS